METPRPSVFLFGASGHAKVVIDMIERAGQARIAGLFDDKAQPPPTTFFGYPLLGGRRELERLFPPGDDAPRAIVTIGENAARRAVTQWLTDRGYGMTNALHPAAIIGRDVSLGRGIVVMAGAVINPCVCVGDGVIINTGASVDHDSRIEPFAHIAPGSRLCGGVSIGENSLIGAAAAVIPGIRIGRYVVVGAGATVTRDVPDHAKVVGSPARPV